jgi:two-component system, OmpR family, manganese sensing sensor histidine kinase
MKMFSKLRLRLTLQFTILATCVYVLLGSIASAFFYAGMTETIDTVLDEVAHSLESAVSVGDNGVMFTRKPLEQVHLRDKHALPTVQLWSANRILVEEYGPAGKEVFLAGETEIQEAGVKLRSINRPINRNSQVVGYLQIQLPVEGRDNAIREFLEALISTAPFLIGGLAAAGYFFAFRAVRPVEESFAMLKRFTADAGHELKTPVAIIRSACDNLAAELKGNTAAMERLEVINRTTERMERLVADLMLLTKTEQAIEEAPRAKAEVPVVELDMIIREILGEFGDLFEDKGIELSADEIEPAKVRADKDSLYKIFSNLLRNCARYTDRGGKVTLGLQRHGDLAVINVSDTGIGIPAESLPKVFDRFYRVDESRARTGGGSGLGLAIVKVMVERFGGSISVTSEVGKGSCFTVYLPVAGGTE